MKSYRKYFISGLEKHFGVFSFELLSETESRFSGLYNDIKFSIRSTNPVDRRLEFCSYFLAMIMVLDRHQHSFEKIRTVCLDIVHEYVKPRNQMEAWVKAFLPKMTQTWLGKLMIEVFKRKVAVKAHENGFKVAVITDPKETFGLGYGFDILACGICSLFKKHQYLKYVTILCEVDEVTSGLAGLELVRTSTIALGAEKCDFRFKKINT